MQSTSESGKEHKSELKEFEDKASQSSEQRLAPEAMTEEALHESATALLRSQATGVTPLKKGVTEAYVEGAPVRLMKATPKVVPPRPEELAAPDFWKPVSALPNFILSKFDEKRDAFDAVRPQEFLDMVFDVSEEMALIQALIDQGDVVFSDKKFAVNDVRRAVVATEAVREVENAFTKATEVINALDVPVREKFRACLDELESSRAQVAQLLIPAPSAMSLAVEVQARLAVEAELRRERALREEAEERLHDLLTSRDTEMEAREEEEDESEGETKADLERDSIALNVIDDLISDGRPAEEVLYNISRELRARGLPGRLRVIVGKDHDSVIYGLSDFTDADYGRFVIPPTVKAHDLLSVAPDGLPTRAPPPPDCRLWAPLGGGTLEWPGRTPNTRDADLRLRKATYPPPLQLGASSAGPNGPPTIPPPPPLLPVPPPLPASAYAREGGDPRPTSILRNRRRQLLTETGIQEGVVEWKPPTAKVPESNVSKDPEVAAAPEADDDSAPAWEKPRQGRGGGEEGTRRVLGAPTATQSEPLVPTPPPASAPSAADPATMLAKLLHEQQQFQRELVRSLTQRADSGGGSGRGGGDGGGGDRRRRRRGRRGRREEDDTRAAWEVASASSGYSAASQNGRGRSLEIDWSRRVTWRTLVQPYGEQKRRYLRSVCYDLYEMVNHGGPPPAERDAWRDLDPRVWKVYEGTHRRNDEEYIGRRPLTKLPDPWIKRSVRTARSLKNGGGRRDGS